MAPEHHYSEDDQAPDVKLRKNTAKKERVTSPGWPPEYPEIYVPNIDGDQALAHSVDCLDAWDAAQKSTNIASMAWDARNLISTQAEPILHALALRADARQPALVRRLEFGGPVDLLAGAAGALC